MDQVVNAQTRAEEQMEPIVSALNGGIMLVNSNGRIVWIDEGTRHRLNGGLKDLTLPIKKSDKAIDCFVSMVDVTINGEPSAVCVIQETGDSDRREFGHDFVAAIEAVMADPSWFTRTVIEKLRAIRQTSRPPVRSSDLDLLTDRECEILGHLCDGRSDIEMAELLSLSHNTVRNHVASLYRKIGVNRRGAAIIWARERAITSREALGIRGRTQRRRDP